MLKLSQVFLTATACALLAVPAMAESQARIVRLSDVQGSVQINKNTGLGFESAFANLPITQGAQLKTGDNGRAEIEFEDGSTLRLTPKTTVEFGTLGNDQGKHVSVVSVSDGMVYVNWLGKGGDQFTLNFAHEKVALDHAAHFRVATSADASKVAVFKGDLSVDSPTGAVAVAKKKTATFDETDKFTLANNVEEAPLDAWDKESISYHDQYAKNNANSPYGYGLSDLNYYGAYSNVPGYGMMWQPFFTGVGWDPFMDGAWSWYPGYGYMFASAYPWGWLPYRYGNWSFIPGYGWMWQPGGWNGWVTVPHYTATSLTNVHGLVAPTGGSGRTVAVGRGGAVSTLATSHVIIRSGSAGLGVPRGSVQSLSHVNREVAKNGFAAPRTAQQWSAASGPRSGSGMGPGRGTGRGVGTASQPRSTMSAPRSFPAPAPHVSASPRH